MNYDMIENLAISAKSGDITAQEALIDEFKPFIINLSKKSFVHSYEFCDMQNECYKTLFKCINLYNPSHHRFVAYATNSIKNSVNYLIRGSLRRSAGDGPSALVMNNKLENTLCCDEDIENIIFMEDFKSKLKDALKLLSKNDRELIEYIFFHKYTLKKYSDYKKMPYSTAVKHKYAAVNKLRILMNIHLDFSYKN